MADRILCVLNRLPYPVIGGREKMLCQALDFMNRTDSEIYLVVFEPRHQWDSLQERFDVLIKKYPKIVNVTVLGLPSPFMCLGNILVRTMILGRKSLQESLFYSTHASYKLSKLTDSVKPDIIYCDSARTAQFFEFSNTNARKIFDADDLLSKRYRIMDNGSNGAEVNLLGNFADKLPRCFKWLGKGEFSHTLMKIEARLMYRRENKLARAFDHVILVSPVEEAELQERNKEAKVHYIYPTMRVSPLDRPELTNGDRPMIAFMGLLNIPHNQVGLEGFLTRIFPNILKQIPTVQLTIIGSNPPEKVLELASQYKDNIVFTGFVEDFAAVLRKARVFVAPIYFGTGIKTKIIDAMSLGLPVVTTPIGAEGLSIRHRENIMVARNDEEFGQCVVELINDSALNNRLSRQAVEYIQEHHNPDKEAVRFRNILGLQQA